MVKTNAMRMLDKAGLPYEVHTYAHGDGKIDGPSVAQKLGQDPRTVFKTLVTQGAGGGYYVFVLPVEKELDLKAAARAVGEKSVAMLPLGELNRVTGYVRGGCSPVGMKKRYPTVFDESVKGLERVMVSGGQIGCQIACAPELLLPLVGAATAPLAM